MRAPVELVDSLARRFEAALEAHLAAGRSAITLAPIAWASGPYSRFTSSTQD